MRRKQRFPVQKSAQEFSLSIENMRDEQLARVKQMLMRGDSFDDVCEFFKVSRGALANWWAVNSTAEERAARNAKIARVVKWVF